MAQVNYFTKSGTNPFHGDFYEIWNGSLFNAEDYFLHANDTPGNIAEKPRSVVNEFGVSVGGPIRKNKLFFFAHYEGIRIALPIVSSGHLAHARLSAICAGPVCHGRLRCRHGYHPSGATCRNSVLQKHVLAATDSRRVAGRDYNLPVGRIRFPVERTTSRHAARRQRLRIPTAALAQ